MWNTRLNEGKTEKLELKTKKEEQVQFFVGTCEESRDLSAAINPPQKAFCSYPPAHHVIL